jgi:hypothetical protein
MAQVQGAPAASRVIEIRNESTLLAERRLGRIKAESGSEHARPQHFGPWNQWPEQP